MITGFHRRRGLAALALACGMALAAPAAAGEVACSRPDKAARGQPKAMTLREISRLPAPPEGRPDRKPPDRKPVVTEGYLIRASAQRPRPSACPPRTEAGYRILLVPSKPRALKEHASLRRAVAAQVPARLLEGRVDEAGEPLPLVGRRVRITGVLTFVPTRHRQSAAAAGVWELRSVSEVAACPDEICPAGDQLRKTAP